MPKAISMLDASTAAVNAVVMAHVFIICKKQLHVQLSISAPTISGGDASVDVTGGIRTWALGGVVVAISLPLGQMNSACQSYLG